jgi:hypothetical protein
MFSFRRGNPVDSELQRDSMYDQLLLVSISKINIYHSGDMIYYHAYGITRESNARGFFKTDADWVDKP